MVRLLKILVRSGLWLLSILGRNHEQPADTASRRLFDALPRPKGRERTLFRTIEWTHASAEPTAEPSVMASPRVPGRGWRVAVVAVTVPVLALVASLAAVAFWTSSGT